MKNKIFITLIIVLLSIQITGCNKPPTNEFEAKIILTCTFNQMDLDYPYLYVAAWTGGLWKVDISNNNFTTTYIPVMDSIENINQIDDVTVNSNDIIISTHTGIWRSIDGGNSWIDIGQNINPLSLQDIDRFPNQPEKIIFDMSYHSIVYHSENYGENWDSTQTNIQSDNSYIEINPYKNNEAWIHGIRAGVGFGVPYLYCIDSCGKHIKLEIDMLNDLHCEDGLNHVNSIAFDPSEPDKLFLCVTNGRRSIYNSSNGGFSWQETSTDTMQIFIMCNDGFSSDKFYAYCTDNNLYCVTDNFQTFEFLGELSHESGGVPISILHEPLRNLLIIGETYGVKVVDLNQIVNME